MINWLIIIVFFGVLFYIHSIIKEKKIFYYLIISFFLIISGFRYGYPSDYFQYVELYNGAYDGSIIIDSSIYGIFYKYLFEIFIFFNFDIQFVYFVSFLIFIIPFAIFLYRYSSNIYISFALFFFINQAFIRSVGNIRNSVAIAVFIIGMFYWMKNLDKKRSIIISIIIASFFIHNSLIIMLPVVYFSDYNFTRNSRLIIFLISISLSFFAVDIFDFIVNNISFLERFQWYFFTDVFQLTNFIKISRILKLTLGLSILLHPYFFKELSKENKLIVNLYFINIYLSALVSFIPIWPLERISQPLMIFELISISVFYKTKMKYKKPFYASLLLYLSWGIFSFLYLSIDAYPYGFLFKILHD